MRAVALVALLLSVPLLAAAAPEPAPSSWPPLSSATVRPGVRVFAAGSQCTTNFVFTSPDNSTLYVGTAAHCVDGLAIGARVDIAPDAKGTLAYSSWSTMARVGEKSTEALSYNDFALVRVDDAHRAKVHPAMRHFGGPVALADSTTVLRGEKVLTYGNSGLRMGVEPSNWHEGYVIGDNFYSWTRSVATVTPGVFGDSGSGLMTGDGRAAGIVVTLGGGWNGVTMLDKALAYAKQKEGIDARLATWPLLDPGVLPEA